MKRVNTYIRGCRTFFAGLIQKRIMNWDIILLKNILKTIPSFEYLYKLIWNYYTQIVYTCLFYKINSNRNVLN